MRGLAWVAVLAGCSFTHGEAAKGDAARGGDATDGSPATGMRRIKLTFHNAARSEALIDFATLVAIVAMPADVLRDSSKRSGGERM